MLVVTDQEKLLMKQSFQESLQTYSMLSQCEPWSHKSELDSHKFLRAQRAFWFMSIIKIYHIINEKWEVQIQLII